MKKFGQFVDSLGGKYITAEDVGMSTKDMEYVRSTTKYVTGIPVSMGGSGDPSPVTAFGVYMGMKAAVKIQFGKIPIMLKSCICTLNQYNFLHHEQIDECKTLFI